MQKDSNFEIKSRARIKDNVGSMPNKVVVTAGQVVTIFRGKLLQIYCGF